MYISKIDIKSIFCENTMTNQPSKMLPVTHVKTSMEDVSANQLLSKEVIDIDTNQKYIVLNCDENYLCNDDRIKRMYNSVVLDPETRRILSIGGCRPYDRSVFENLYPAETEGSNIILEEMIEGVTVQLFFDHRMNKWEISTRNSVAGKYAYYRMQNQTCKTFREMLFDAMELPGGQRELEHWNGLQYLNDSFCYHFIMQHPANHIVFQHEKPALYYTGCCELHFGGVENDICYTPVQCGNPFPEHFVKVPRVAPSVEPFTYNGNVDKYMSLHHPLETMGMCFLHKNTGDRSFVIAPQYKELQDLRGTHPNLMFQYVCLRRIDKVNDFLKHFPLYKETFKTFHNAYETAIRNLHQSYVDRFVKKSFPEVQSKYKYHVGQLHLMYKASLNEPEKLIIRKNIVRKYVSSLEPGAVFHMIRGFNEQTI